MRIVVSSQSSNGLDSPISLTFGRCPYFTAVDVEDNNIVKVDTVPNTGARAFHGAGIQAAQIVANLGAQVVISGSFGPNAFASLSQLGVKLFSAPPGLTVKDAVLKYLQGQLLEVTAPTRGPHFGMGGGRGGGMGGGMGRRWQI
ncbi:MAG: NifB/NifX family molybdenum-iron cluster-binding protein [Candidatus Odinarchaeia archaeon]